MRRRRAGTAALATAGAALALTAAADAATVGIPAATPEQGDPPFLLFAATPGEANRVVIASVPESTGVSFRDSGAALVAGPGCAVQPDTSVLCTVADLTEVELRLGDGDDELDARALTRASFHGIDRRMVAFGESGNDSMTGANADSCMYGEAGDDRLTTALSDRTLGACENAGGAGDDVLTGSAFNDYFTGGSGNDVINAGGGDDFAMGEAGDDRISMGAGPDRAADGPGDDRTLGGAGRDELTDREGDDFVDGGADDDELTASFRGEGEDELRGGAGTDLVTYICRGCRVTLNGRADDGQQRADNVLETEDVTMSSGFYDDESETTAIFGPGNDVVIGNAEPNALNSSRGPDLVIGGDGPDEIQSGDGPDRIRAADGVRDIVDCGASKDDRALADPKDDVTRCEHVRIRRAG